MSDPVAIYCIRCRESVNCVAREFIDCTRWICDQCGCVIDICWKDEPDYGDED